MMFFIEVEPTLTRTALHSGKPQSICKSNIIEFFLIVDFQVFLVFLECFGGYSLLKIIKSYNFI